MKYTDVNQKLRCLCTFIFLKYNFKTLEKGVRMRVPETDLEETFENDFKNK